MTARTLQLDEAVQADLRLGALLGPEVEEHEDEAARVEEREEDGRHEARCHEGTQVHHLRRGAGGEIEGVWGVIGGGATMAVGVEAERASFGTGASAARPAAAGLLLQQSHAAAATAAATACRLTMATLMPTPIIVSPSAVLWANLDVS